MACSWKGSVAKGVGWPGFFLKSPEVRNKLKPRNSVHHIFSRDFVLLLEANVAGEHNKSFRETINIGWYKNGTVDGRNPAPPGMYKP